MIREDPKRGRQKREQVVREGQTLSNLSIGAIENFPFLFITLDRFSGRAAFQKGLEIRLGGFENKMAFLNSYFTF